MTSPIVKQMRVVPVAGRDGMLLNLSGAHAPFFTRNVVLVTDSAGHIHLAADHPEGYDRYSPMVSRLLHLMVIDVLATSVALKIGGARLQPLLREIKNNLRAKRYA